MNNIFQGYEDGQQVVKLLTGGGFETASIQTIEKIDTKTNTLYLEGCDEDYNRNSIYAYDMATGHACKNYVGGFSSRIVGLEE